MQIIETVLNKKLERIAFQAALPNVIIDVLIIGSIDDLAKTEEYYSLIVRLPYASITIPTLGVFLRGIVRLQFCNWESANLFLSGEITNVAEFEDQNAPGNEKNRERPV